MSFLDRLRPAQPAAETETEELPARRRTFSASQYREEELARAAEIRIAQEAADEAAAEAAALARAQRIADAEAERLEEAGEEEEEGGEPAGPPMDWEEAVGWLSTKSAEAR